MAGNKEQIKEQLKADPRVNALADSRRRGNIPGVVTAAELRQFGYDVEPDWKYTTGNADAGGRLQRGIMDPSSTAGDIITGAGTTLLGLGTAGAFGYGPLAGASAAPGAAAAADPLAGTVYAPVSAGASQGVSSGGGGLGGFFGGILGGAKKGLGWLFGNSGGAGTARDILGGAGGAAASIAQTQAANRANQLYAQYLRAGLGTQREQEETTRDKNFWDQQVQRESEGRASGTDAWNKLLATQHTLSPGPRPQLSPYSVKPREATDTERSGAQALSAEVMRRLEGGNPLPMPTRRADISPDVGMDMDLASAGGVEQTLGWLAPIFGAFRPPPTANMPPTPNTPSTSTTPPSPSQKTAAAFNPFDPDDPNSPYRFYPRGV